MLEKFINNGEMAEWSKAVASKAIIPGNWNRGFESHSLLHPTPRLRLAGHLLKGSNN